MVYTISCREYSETATYYDWDKDHKYPNYYPIEDSVEYSVEANSLDHAELWLLKNHPKRYFGASIYGDSNNFLILPVPGISYGDLSREQVISNRIDSLERRGIVL